MIAEASTMKRLAVYALGAATVILVPSLFVDAPIWDANRTIKIYLLLVITGYVACALILDIRRSIGAWRVRALNVLICVAILAPLLILRWLPVQPARTSFGIAPALSAHVVILPTLLLAGLMLALISSLQRYRNLQLVALSAIVVAATAGHFAAAREKAIQRPRMFVRHLNSNLYTLRATFYEHWLETPQTRGGGLARFGDKLMLMTGDGDFYLMGSPASGADLPIQHLALHVPINRDEFVRDTSAVRSRIDSSVFRAAGILIQEAAGKTRILASHHFWKRSERCTVVRISELDGSQKEIVAGEKLQWKTLFETTPCLRLERADGLYFGGISGGGRIVQLNDHELLVTVGDHEFDGTGSTPALSQDMTVSYGKTIVVDVNSGASRIYSSGHRNPQGLYVDESGRMWSTEHGPQGGDELNVVEEGKNYGWPLVTYGVDYGTHAWPLNQTQGDHAGFTKPVYAWVPSIGVSNLTGISKDLFSLWKGDLIVGSMVARTLWRLRTADDNHVLLAEPIPLEYNIRDVAEDKDGRLVLWTNQAVIVFLEPERDVDSLAGLFFSRCSGCHSLADNSQHRMGPDLSGVVGRRSGQVAGYGYSPAMRAASTKWTPERLDLFLADPQQMVPGSSMQFSVADPQERKRIIAYLAAPDRGL